MPFDDSGRATQRAVAHNSNRVGRVPAVGAVAAPDFTVREECPASAHTQYRRRFSQAELPSRSESGFRQAPTLEDFGDIRNATVADRLRSAIRRPLATSGEEKKFAVPYLDFTRAM